MNEQLKLYIETIFPKVNEVIVTYVKCDKKYRMDSRQLETLHNVVKENFPNNKVIIVPELCNIKLMNINTLKQMRDVIDKTIYELE